MADPITSALVNEVVGRLSSAAIQEYGLLRELKTDLSALENTFKLIQGVLHDAEEKQRIDKRVDQWLKILKSASLEVENVFDKVKTEAMIQRLHREMGKRYKIRAFFSSRYNPLMARFRIAHKVKNIRKKLEDIDADRSKFELTPNTTSKDDAGIGGESNRETSSRMSKIYGRAEDKMMIVDKICNQDIGITDDNNDVRVYAIWGMGGIGKTTLAQYVYNHEMVRKNFDLKFWVYVSTVFDVKRIIKQILKAIWRPEDLKLEEMPSDALQRQIQNKLDDMSLDDLETLIERKLSGKKYFIIMDDVWIENDDMGKWNELCKALNCAEKGSTVMITTRKKDTAQLMAKISELQHNVAVLSKEESWSLFKMLAIPDRGEGEHVSSELELVGKEIVEKCNGLPLAVKTLGTLMSTKKRVDQWQLVNKNFKSKMQDNVLTALRLSYDDLPPHMKICFAYCCVFSKGEEMSKDSLIELWMANGFIPSQGDASLYELGEEIFDCLLGRSFFQDVVEEDTDTVRICKMHDFMHDLAQSVMKHDCAILEPGMELIIPDEVHEVLHLSLSSQMFHLLIQDLEKLRSLRSVSAFFDKRIFSQVYLRVLYLRGIKSSKLPKSICKLMHLRYLKIEFSDIKVLPDSFIYLQNLQTLILKGCYHFRELPKGLRYMRNLQRLDIGWNFHFEQMPVGIKELTNLRLSQFFVGYFGARIGELGNLNRLGWYFLLANLENVRGLEDAKSAKLKDKTNLKSLTLQWSWSATGGRSERIAEEVVEGLEPNSGLHELEIQFYVGRVISPSWMAKLVNLTSIKLLAHLKCEQLPPLGKLPSLKRINLEEMRSLKCFHDDDNVASKDGILFSSLQKLHLKLCTKLVSLPSNFPKLRSLKIKNCDELRSLPDEIQSFKDLNQITIKDCDILSRRCEKDVGEDWPKISRIPFVNMTS